MANSPDSLRCAVCGVALVMTSWHCPLHAVKFGAGTHGPLHFAPVIGTFVGPRDLERHSHVDTDGTAKPIRSEVVQAATSIRVVPAPVTWSWEVLGIDPRLDPPSR